MDCMEGMKQYPDKYFDLAIVDPPYGLNEDSHRQNERRSNLAKSKVYHDSVWKQSVPSMEYFDELGRISKNQIVWGANHFGGFTPSPCWIVWDKDNGENDFADCELAFTSFGTAVRKFTYRWQGMLQGNMANKENRIHPTQKPVALYRWLLKNYGGSSIGTKILDTHLGSGSSRIAAFDMGFDFTGFEIDKGYFDASEKRFQQHIAQLKIF